MQLQRIQNEPQNLSAFNMFKPFPTYTQRKINACGENGEIETNRQIKQENK